MRFFSLPFIVFSKSLSFINFLILGPTKITGFNFSCLKKGNFTVRNLCASERLQISQSIQIWCVIVDARFGEGKYKWSMHDDFSSWNKSFPLWQNFYNPMFWFCPTVPSAKKASLFCVPSFCHISIHLTLKSPQISQLCTSYWIHWDCIQKVVS